MASCFSDRGTNALKALRVTLLSTLWTLEMPIGDTIRQAFSGDIYEVENKISSKEDRLFWLSHMVVFLLATFQTHKELESFLNHYVLPVIMESVDVMFDVIDDEEEDDRILEESINAFSLIIGNIGLPQRYVIVKKTNHLFMELLEHPRTNIKIATFKACVTFGQLLFDGNDNEEDYGIDLTEMVKSMTRCIYESSDDLDRDQTNYLESLLRRIQDSDYDVAVSSIKLSAYSPKDKKNQPSQLRSKKTNPTTGYMDAFIIEYIQKVLGHVYSKLVDPSFSLGFPDFIDGIIDHTFTRRTYDPQEAGDAEGEQPVLQKETKKNKKANILLD